MNRIAWMRGLLPLATLLLFSPVLGFGFVMTVGFSAFVVLLGWIPSWRDLLLTSLFDLSPELLTYVSPAMKVLFVAPVLLGLTFSFQALTSSPNAPQGFAWTNAIELTITP